MRLENALNLLSYASSLVAFTCVMQQVQVSFVLAFALLFFIAIYRDHTQAFTVPRWSVNLLSILVMVPVTLRLKPDRIVEPILEALLILLSVKLLEVKKPRDYMQVYLLCLFLLVGSGLLSVSAVFLLHFALLSVLLTTSLMALTFRSQDEGMVLSSRHLFKILSSAMAMCAITLPLTALFFVILPRTPYPLVNLLSHRVESRSGFSDKVSLGEVSAIQLDRRTVFRAVMEPVQEKSLYWRGIVLDEFTGTGWRRSFQSHEEQPGAPPGKEIPQTIYLDPYGSHHLFVLDKPVSVSAQNLRRLQGLTFSLQDIPEQKLRYTARSIPSEILPEAMTKLDHYLQLPEGMAPEILALPEDILGTGGTHADRADRLQRFLRDGNFTYTLEELPRSESPLEDFLLETRRGNCEYFASALAVMLRAAGIPSRIVGGYRGGTYNRAAGYYLVLQSDAHVWVEAYIPSRGWLRLDPTPPLPPGAGKLRGHQLGTQLRLTLDTINYYWTRLVINYDLSSQVALVRAARDLFTIPNLEWSREAARAARVALAAVVALLVVACLTVLAWKRPHVEQRIVAKFLKRMAAHGYERSPHEGLEEFVSRIEGSEIREKSMHFVQEFQKTFYRDERFTRDRTARLEKLIRDL